VVKWTNPARLDLKQGHDYIARDSKFYAKKVSQEFVDKSEKLDSFSKAGRIVPEIGDPNICELIIYSYRLICEIFPDKIEVLALIHGKRNFAQTFPEGQKH
jgi:plasmid stabilization system protein ParE